jgi:hypothetical protein
MGYKISLIIRAKQYQADIWGNISNNFKEVNENRNLISKQKQTDTDTCVKREQSATKCVLKFLNYLGNYLDKEFGKVSKC